MQRSIELSESQLHELERLASKERRSVDELVQIAVGDYLARRGDQSTWSALLDDIVARIREDLPADATPDEIEADVTAAWQEHRAARAAERDSASGRNASGH
jgi:Arc/MetJ-type ribon-helix-helix transcriptional regulator